MKPGIYATMPMSEYQADEAISGSDLVKIAQSGMERWKFEKTQPRDCSRAMDVGSAVHHLLGAKLLGADPEPLIQVFREGSSRTKGFEKFRASLMGETVGVDADEFNIVERCVDAVLKSKECRQYLDGALIEHSYFCEDAETKLMRKCRPDFLNEKERVSINVKTCQDSSDYGFIRSVKDYGYDLQTVNYESVLKSSFGHSFNEIHILIEKSESGPVKLAIRAIDDDTLDNARWVSRRVLKAIAKAKVQGSFADPAPKLMTSLVPAWARTSAEWLDNE